MKKILMIMSILVIFYSNASATIHGGTPTIAGGTGILTVPTASTVAKGGLDLSCYYIHAETFALSAGFGLLDRLELSFGFELDGDTGFDNDPFLHFKAKYRFSGTRANGWAFGIEFDWALGDDNTNDDTAFSLYIVNSYAISSWLFTWGLGYTFENQEKENINFMIGISRQIIQNLYIEADFSNFSYRHTFIDSRNLNRSRGIGNIALRLHLFDGKLRFTLGLFDAFDNNRELGGGVAFKLQF